MQFRRGTAARLAEVNEILLAGQPGFETDTGQVKVGNGTDRWVGLPYIGEGLTVNAGDVVGLGDLAFINTSGDSADFLDGTGAFVPIPGVTVPTYAPGDFTVATENYLVMSRHLKLTTTQRATLQGTATLRIT